MTAPSRRPAIHFDRRAARTIAACLIAYGALGLVTLAAIAASLAPTLGAVDAFATSSRELRLTLDRTHDAFEGFGASLRQAERSTDGAATAARQGSETARRISGAMSVSIFGAQPLLPLAKDFEQQAQELTTLATELDDLAAALRRDQGDIAALQDQLIVLRDSPALAGAPSRPPVPVAVVLFGLLLWLALQAGAALGGGVLLWRYG